MIFLRAWYNLQPKSTDSPNGDFVYIGRAREDKWSGGKRNENKKNRIRFYQEFFFADIILKAEFLLELEWCGRWQEMMVMKIWKWK